MALWRAVWASDHDGEGIHALLMSLAAGALAHGSAAVIAAHAERCPRCLKRLPRLFQLAAKLLAVSDG